MWHQPLKALIRGAERAKVRESSGFSNSRSCADPSIRPFPF
jgi:hypothetical protein